MALLAAFDVLLSRYSGQSDIVIGTAAGGRSHTELEGLVGCFLNMLTVRTDLWGDPSFRDLIGRVRGVTLDAFANRDVPFELLVDELEIERDHSRNPLFQVAFAVHHSAGDPLHMTGLAVSEFDFAHETTHFNLDAHIWLAPDSSRVDFVYSTQLFDQETISGMAAAFGVLLEAIAHQPDRALSTFPLVCDSDGRQLVGSTLFSSRSLESGARLHELFENQSERTPDAIAAGCNGRSFTYAELESSANQLANRLLELGITNEDRVGLRVERGLDMLVGLLGILKAGAAWAPLAPDLPAERLGWVLSDTAAPVLVTHASLAPAPCTYAGVQVLMDSESDALAARDATRPRRLGEQSDLAYVIYTSGSTGEPKGVQVQHRAIVNLLLSMIERPGFQADDILLAVTTLSFDISILELFAPLLSGGRVEIATQEVISDGRRLAKAIVESGATVMQATPATWQMLLLAEWNGCPGLKMLCGGEALPRPLAEELLVRGQELWNMYGPTETTVWSAISRVVSGEGPVPLGEPITGTALLVLDERLRPVPPGAVGELFIGGEGLARGYLNRAELTSSRFLTSPWPDELSGRLYRTSDRARLTSDGRLLFLGARITRSSCAGTASSSARSKLDFSVRRAFARPSFS